MALAGLSWTSNRPDPSHAPNPSARQRTRAAKSIPVAGVVIRHSLERERVAASCDPASKSEEWVSAQAMGKSIEPRITTSSRTETASGGEVVRAPVLIETTGASVCGRAQAPRPERDGAGVATMGSSMLRSCRFRNLSKSFIRSRNASYNRTTHRFDDSLRTCEVVGQLDESQSCRAWPQQSGRHNGHRPHDHRERNT